MGTKSFPEYPGRRIPETESKTLQKKQTRRQNEARGGIYQKNAAEMRV
jgi:hypothetical protein